MDSDAAQQPVPSPFDPSQVPDVPIDQELAVRVTNLYAEVDKALDELDVPEKERKEIEQNLMEAIAADLLVRLGERLSDEDKQALAKMAEESGDQPDLQAVAGFFRTKFAQEELVTHLAEATESVLKEFTSAMTE